jgi:hypothetical protein
MIFVDTTMLVGAADRRDEDLQDGRPILAAMTWHRQVDEC